MYHIKRDGGYLCKPGPLFRKQIDRGGAFITFSQAHKMELHGCCQACTKKYYEIVSKLDTPVVHLRELNPKYRKKDKPITKTIVISNSLAGLQ